MALEVAPQESAELEFPEPRCASVRLHLKGVSVSAVVKSESDPTVRAVQLVGDPRETVKALKSKLWHANLDKSKLRKDCEDTVKEMKAAVKAKSREVLRQLHVVSATIEESDRHLRRAFTDARYFRKQNAELQEANAGLKQQVEAAHTLIKTCLRDASRANRAAAL